MNFIRAAAVASLAVPTLLAAQAQTTTNRAWKVDDLMRQSYAVALSPNEPIWSPDNRTLTYLDPATDNLMAVDPATARTSLLVSHDKLDSIMHPQISEKDRDHRNRYETASYVFAPDPNHILFDAGGELWVYNLQNGTGVNVASSGSGSGDDPKFSPDAQYVSYVKDHNLFIRSLHGAPETNLSNTKEPSLLNGEVDWVYEEELDVRSNYFWSPDSKNLAYLQANEARVPLYPIVDWIPTHPTTDQQRYPQPGDPNPDVRVGVVGMNGGVTRWIKLPLSPGNDYIPRFGWLNAHTLWIETLTRDHRHRTIWFADTRTGNAKPAIEESCEKFFDENYDVMLLKRASLILFTSWRDGHNHIYAYRFDASDPMAAQPALVGELDKGDYDVDEMEGADETHGLVFYNSNQSDPRERQVYAAKLDGSGQKRITTTHGFNKGTFSENGALFADETSDTIVPPTMNVCTAAGACQQYWHGPQVEAGLTVREPQQMELKAPDGVTLYATLLMPQSATSAASVPLINNPYGGPHAQEVEFRFNPGIFLDQLLTERGFAVLHADNEGMGMRGRDFAWKAYRNFGPIQFADQQAVIDQVLAKYPQLDAKRLGWWGWSWGGTFTLYAMTHSDRFRAGVAVAPVTNWRNYDSIYTERYMGLPDKEADEYNNDSVTTSAKDLSGRLLLVHGTGDDNVHMQNSIQFIEELVQHDIPYDLQLYPRKTHSIAGIADRTHLYDRIVRHFEQNLRDAKQP